MMCRHCDVELDYFWPSDHLSEDGSSVSKLQLTPVTETTEGETVISGGDYCWASSSMEKINRKKNLLPSLTFLLSYLKAIIGCDSLCAYYLMVYFVICFYWKVFFSHKLEIMWKQKLLNWALKADWGLAVILVVAHQAYNREEMHQLGGTKRNNAT